MYGNTHAFVVRIWPEALDNHGNVTLWRGSIEHVGSGTRLHFDDFNELVHFIREQSEFGKQAPVSWWRFLLTWIRL
jgi:hypothetical protein